MNKPLTDAELDALEFAANIGAGQVLGGRAGPTILAQVAIAIAELRALRENLAAAELRESIWRAGPDDMYEAAQQNAALVTALEQARGVIDVDVFPRIAYEIDVVLARVRGAE